MAKKPSRNEVFVQIDENLKRVFAEDAAEDLPPRLLNLLQQLDQIDAPQDGDDDDPVEPESSA